MGLLHLGLDGIKHKYEEPPPFPYPPPHPKAYKGLSVTLVLLSRKWPGYKGGSSVSALEDPDSAGCGLERELRTWGSVPDYVDRGGPTCWYFSVFCVGLAALCGNYRTEVDD